MAAPSSDCIFCEIIARRAPAYFVYEDAEIVAFLDRYPISDGHTLVLPRTHYERFDDLPVETLRSMYGAVQRLNRRIRERMQTEGAHISVNDGRAAHQLVPHIHVHIIPRKENDDATFTARKRYTHEQMEAIRKRLRD
jgi:histidine triad (HIT) family protein